MRRYLLLLLPLLFAGCDRNVEEVTVSGAPEATVEVEVDNGLSTLLDAQPADVKARYMHRHPKETLEFFGIEPGMTVVEGLPGQGWYSKLLVNYLGSEGRLIGANYSMTMWPLFPFANEEFLTGQEAWADNFKVDAAGWGGTAAASVDAFYFGSLPSGFAETADVVFFPRVLHNLANFQNAGKGDFLDEALADVRAILKPGGVFGIVQHHARDDMSDEFAMGGHGYLKKGWLIAKVEDAGFEFVAESDINANAKDQPAEEDIVWRLPPTYNGARDNPELVAALDAIGESNRMTLKFRKPLSKD